jgi:hypothetical protein
MKFFLVALFLYSSFAYSETVVSTKGYGYDWGNTAADIAQLEAVSLAKEKCKSDVLQIGLWNIVVINHKEGMLYVSAEAQFQCIGN